MKIEPLAIAPECGRNHHPPAFDNKAHVAQRGFVENRVHGGAAAVHQDKPPVLHQSRGGFRDGALGLGCLLSACRIRRRRIWCVQTLEISRPHSDSVARYVAPHGLVPFAIPKSRPGRLPIAPGKRRSMELTAESRQGITYHSQRGLPMGSGVINRHLGKWPHAGHMSRSGRCLFRVRKPAVVRQVEPDHACLSRRIQPTTHEYFHWKHPGRRRPATSRAPASGLVLLHVGESSVTVGVGLVFLLPFALAPLFNLTHPFFLVPLAFGVSKGLYLIEPVAEFLVFQFEFLDLGLQLADLPDVGHPLE